MRHFSTILACLFCTSCGPEDVLPEGELAPLTTLDWPPAVPVSVPADAPIDPREVLLHLESYAGQERLCDLSYLGELTTTPSGGARRTIRCVGTSGAGWADLVFPEAAHDLSNFVRVGERVRILCTGDIGFEGYPEFQFVADIGPAERAREPRDSAPALGSDWYAIASRGDREIHRCALSWVGAIRAIDGDDSHSGPMSCRSRAGERAVIMVFPEVTHRSALRIRRGEVVPARLVDGSGTIPVIRYEGP